MKTLIEFRFWTAKFNAILDAPKHLVTKSNYMATTVLIDREDSKFAPLWAWASTHPSATILDPLPKYVYTKQELMTAEIFYLPYIDMAPAELVSDDYGTKYRVVKKKGRFEVKEQTTPLFVDTNRLSKSKDFQQLLTDEVLINKRLADILAKNHIQGYELLPVFRPKRIHRWGDDIVVKNSEGVQSSNWFQLNVTAIAGPIAQPPTEYGSSFLELEPSNTGTYQVKALGLISSPKIGTSLYFNRAGFPHTDIVRTRELNIAEIPYPYIMITQKLYRIFMANKVKGFEVRPAYFVD